MNQTRVLSCSGEDQEDPEEPDGDGDTGGGVHPGADPHQRQGIPVDQEWSGTGEQRQI